MSVSLAGLEIPIRAIDEASAVFKKVEDQAKRSMGEVEESTKKVTYTQQQMTDGLRGVVTGFSGVATSAFNLYNAYDRVADQTVAIDRANLMVKSTLDTLEDTQRRYNATVEKYGIESEQAVAAAKDLQLAQERYGVAAERAAMLQGNLNEMIVTSVISVVPTAITMIDSLIRIKQSWAAAQAALNVVMNANPIMLIVTAIGLLTAALVTAYYTCKPFHDAVDSLGAALMNVLKPAIDAVSGAFDWLWKNVMEPLMGAFNAFSNAVSGFFAWLGIKLPSIQFPTIPSVTGGGAAGGGAGGAGAGGAGGGAAGGAGGGGVTVVTLTDTQRRASENLTKATLDLDAGLRNATASTMDLDKGLKDLKASTSDVSRRLSILEGSLEAAEVSPSATATVARTIRGPLEAVQFGFEGLVRKPTMFLAGEAGPEWISVVPGATPKSSISVVGPLVYVEGSADRETAELAARKVEDSLRSVILEASSASAPETHKRIRFGGIM